MKILRIRWNFFVVQLRELRLLEVTLPEIFPRGVHKVARLCIIGEVVP